MTALLIRKGVLRPGDLRNAPSANEVRRPQVSRAATWQFLTQHLRARRGRV